MTGPDRKPRPYADGILRHASGPPGETARDLYRREALGVRGEPETETDPRRREPAR